MARTSRQTGRSVGALLAKAPLPLARGCRLMTPDASPPAGDFHPISPRPCRAYTNGSSGSPINPAPAEPLRSAAEGARMAESSIGGVGSLARSEPA